MTKATPWRANRRRHRPIDSAHEPAAGSQGDDEEAIGLVRLHVREARFQAAVEAAEALLARRPGQPDALYLLAVARRYLSDVRGARRALDELTALAPRFARGWQELGHLNRATGDYAGAVAAYGRAVSLNDALIPCWQGLADTASRRGDHDLVGRARARLAYLSSLPAELVTVLGLANEGRALAAEKVCRAFLKRNPKHVEGMRLLASFAVEHGILDDAEFLLESALEFEPDNRRARIDYIDVLHKRQKYARSLDEARKLRRAHPADPIAELSFANQSAAVGDFGQAIRIYDDVMARYPRASFTGAALRLTRGHSLKARGRVNDAIAAYRDAYATRADCGDAYWSLANLKTYRFTDAEMARMRELVAAPETATEDRIHVLFALGKALEDLARYDDSFAAYAEGNRLRHEQCGKEAVELSDRMQRQRHVCTEAFFRERAGSGAPDPDPIFVVGLPRAGSTLLEQILASHSAIDGTLEFHHIGGVAQRLDGRRRRGDPPRYPARLAELDMDTLRGIGEAYLDDTRVHRQGAPFFVDKMPNNFRHLGLIHLVLPNARVIDARREPMACCFSNFKQLFASGQEFTYDLETLATYYRDYVALMAHWDRVLPGKVLRVNHEGVVADLDTQVRRMLDFLELPFEQACIDFHRTHRAVRTPSSEQVRQPIFTEGLDQWRHFERHLGALKHSLGDLCAARRRT